MHLFVECSLTPDSRWKCFMNHEPPSPPLPIGAAGDCKVSHYWLQGGGLIGGTGCDAAAVAFIYPAGR